MDSLSKSVATFSTQFLNEMEKGKSVVASPLSCEILLALLTLGSVDPAHNELIKALHISNDSEIRKSFKSLASSLKSVKGVTLNVANKVYIKEGQYNLHPELDKDSKEVFDAELEKADFGKAVETANIINNWVETKTNKKIKDLIKPDSINDATRLVLVNAIYFKGLWKNKFQESNTRDEDFFVTASTKIRVPMMSQEAKFRYGVSEALNAKLLELPYEGGDASMVIILPDEVEGLNGVLQKLASGHDLMQEYQKMNNMEVNAIIPKFKIETSIDLIPLLQKLGIKAIFDASKPTGLTKILDQNEELYVSAAIQKAFIEVSEEGTEAAAATGMVMMMRCMPMPKPEFRADRPFIYMLMDAARTTFFTGVFNGEV